MSTPMIAEETPSVSTETSSVSTETSSVSTETSSVSTACPNCQTTRSGTFCASCGQHFWESERLSILKLFKVFVQRFFIVDRVFLRTIGEMFTDPGGLIRRYIGGQRRRYLNPFTYLFISTTLYVLIYRFSDLEERMIEALMNTGQDQAMALPIMTDFMHFIFLNLEYMTLLWCLPFALMLRVFFRKELNFAESFVFALFIFAHINFISACITVPNLVLNPDTVLAFGSLTMLVAFAIYVGLTIWTAATFFKNQLAPLVKATLSLLLSYGILILLIGLGFAAYLFTNPQAAQGAQPEQTLLWAVENDRVDKVDELLEQGAEVNQQWVTTALLRAAVLGHQPVAEKLLAAGADMSAADEQGRTPLFLALHMNWRDLADTLAHHVVDPNARDHSGTTLLMEATRISAREVVATLVEKGGDLNAIRDHEQATALMISVAMNKTETTPFLLNHGADPTLQNANGETALDLAQHSEIIEMLQAALAERTPPNEEN